MSSTGRTTVSAISKSASLILKEMGVKIEYGYGDVFHFTGIPGSHAGGADIDTAFVLNAVSFVVHDGTLKLESEVKHLPSLDEERDALIKLLDGMVGTSQITADVRRALLRQLGRIK